MYGKANLCSINEARLELFLKTYKPKGKKPLSGVKGIDGSNLPPCKSVLLQQIKRANVICSSWNRADQTRPSTISPDGNGWHIQDEKYTPTWFEGDMSPPTLEEIICEEDATDDDESDYTSETDEDLSCEDD